MEGGSVQLQPFLGISFRLIGFDPEAEAKVRSLLIKGSGVDAFTIGQDYSHLIVGDLEYDDPACLDARNSGKIIVNNIWVNHSVEIGVAVDSNSVIYRPVRDLNGIPGSKNFIVCLTGYQRQDREDIMIMTRMMGAQFSKPLVANKVTHLVCYKFEGEKYELAKKLKRIKLVNHRWLEDCLKNWTLLPEECYSTSGFELEITESEAKDSDVEADYQMKNVTQLQKESCHNPVIGNNFPLSLRKEEHQGLIHPIKSEFPILNHSGLVEKSRESLIETKDRLEASETRTDPYYLKLGNVEKSSWRSPKATNCGASNIAKLSEKDEIQLNQGSITEKTDVKVVNELDSSNSSGAGTREDEKSYSSPRKTIFPEEQQNCTSAILSSGQLACKLPSQVISSEMNVVKSSTDLSVRHANARKACAKRPAGSKMKLNPITNQKGTIFLEKKNESKVNSSASLPLFVAVTNLELQSSSKDPRVDEAIDSVNKSNEICDIDCTPKAPQNNKRGRKKAVRESVPQEPNDIKKAFEKNSGGDSVIGANLCRSPSKAVKNENTLSSKRRGTPLADDLEIGLKRKRDVFEVRRASVMEVQSDLCTTIRESEENAVSTTEGDVSEEKRAGAKKTRNSTNVDRTDISDAKKEIEGNALSSTKNDLNVEKRTGVKKKKTSTTADETVISPTKNCSKGNTLSSTKGDLSEIKRANVKKTRTSAKEEENIISSAKNERGGNALSSTKGDLCEVKRENARKIRTLGKEEETIVSASKTLSERNALSSTKDDLSEIKIESARKSRSLAKGKEGKSFARTGRKTRRSILAEESASDVKSSETVHSTKEETVMLTKNSRNTRSMTEKENVFPAQKDEEKVVSTKGIKSGNSTKRNETDLSANEEKRKRENEEEKKCFIVSGERSERKEYQQIIKRLGGKCCKDSHRWSYEATHFIAPAPLRRTEKFFAAAASGRWILKTDYLWACQEAGKLLDEEAYEWHGDCLSEDGAISLGAPRKWRVLRGRTGHCAFHGMRIVVYGECIAPSLDTLKRVLKSGGGMIVATCPPYTRFLTSGIDYAVISQGTEKVDPWVQQFLEHGIPCVLADYLVDFVCKPGFPIHKHILFDSLPS